MKLYDNQKEDFPVQYALYNPKICRQGLIDVAKYYYAYAKGDYILEKTLPAGMICYDKTNQRLYRFGISYSTVPHVFVKVFETIYVTAAAKHIFSRYDYGICVKSETPIKFIQIKLSDALYLAKWQKEENYE